MDVQVGLRDPNVGLGYATLETACQADFATSGLAGVLVCVLGQHSCATEQLLDLEAPRLRELLIQRRRGRERAGGAHVPAPTVAEWGAGLGDTETGKDLVKCTAGISKAARKFVDKKQKSVAKCIARLFRCEQTKSDDPSCEHQSRAGVREAVR